MKRLDFILGAIALTAVLMMASSPAAHFLNQLCMHLFRLSDMGKMRFYDGGYEIVGI